VSEGREGIFDVVARQARPGQPVRPGHLDDIVYAFERGTAPEVLPDHGFFTDTSICIGCKACEVACKQWNQLPADGVRWGNGYDNTGALSATSWRHVKFVERFPSAPAMPVAPTTRDGGIDLSRLLAEPKAGAWLMLSDQCKHCFDAPCHKVCPTGAIVQNEYRGIFIQPDLCTGCQSCVSVCPFGVPQVGAADGHSHKCTMCYDRLVDDLKPACATACPTGAIAFGMTDDLLASAQTRLATLQTRGHDGAQLYGDRPGPTYSQLQSFYLLLDKPAVYGLPENPVDPWIHMRGDYARGALSLLAGVVLAAAAWLVGAGP
jgi:formate dehydrogenase iron-sulfur subunit